MIPSNRPPSPAPSSGPPMAMFPSIISTKAYPLDIPLGEFGVLRTLGRGGYGEVKLVRNALTNEKVAVKIIPKDRKSRDKKPAHNSTEKYYYRKDDPSKKSKRKCRYTRRATLQERVMREVHFTRYLHHPHIVSLLDFREDEKCFYLFYEYIDGAPLAAYIGRQGMVEKDAQRFFRQLASALEYCHRHCIVHRDVKVDNIVIDEHDNVKLIDFGLANHYRVNAYLETSCGSMPYSSPEILLGKSYVGPEVDVWSLGVILYVMVTGKLPFGNPAERRQMKALLAGKLRYVPEDVSNDCIDCIRQCLQPDPWKRITSYRLLQHPFLQQTTSHDNTTSSTTSVEQDQHWPLASPYLKIHYPLHMPSIAKTAECMDMPVETVCQIIKNSIVSDVPLTEETSDVGEAIGLTNTISDASYTDTDSSKTKERKKLKRLGIVASQSIVKLINTYMKSKPLLGAHAFKASSTTLVDERLTDGRRSSTGSSEVHTTQSSNNMVYCTNSPEVAMYALVESYYRRHHAVTMPEQNMPVSTYSRCNQNTSQHTLVRKPTPKDKSIRDLWQASHSPTTDVSYTTAVARPNHTLEQLPLQTVDTILTYRRLSYPHSSTAITTSAAPTASPSVSTIREAFTPTTSEPLPISIACHLPKLLFSRMIIYRAFSRPDKTIALLMQVLCQPVISYAISNDRKRIAITWRPSINHAAHNQMVYSHSCVMSVQLWHATCGLSAIAVKHVGGSRQRFNRVRNWMQRELHRAKIA